MLTAAETDFGALLSELWARRRLTQREFAQRVRCKEAYVCRVRTGSLLPPADHVLNIWADELHASVEETERLKDLAALERTPLRIRRKLINLSLAAAS